MYLVCTCTKLKQDEHLYQNFVFLNIMIITWEFEDVLHDVSLDSFRSLSTAILDFIFIHRSVRGDVTLLNYA